MKAKEFINSDINVTDLSDFDLCEIADDSPDWEFCEVYGILDELSDRTGIDFIVNDEFNDSLVYDAMEKLGYVFE